MTTTRDTSDERTSRQSTTVGYPVGLLPDGQFDQLRALVDRAQSGEIDLGTAVAVEAGAPIDEQGKLPSGWYAPLLPETSVRRVRPELLAGMLGLVAGLVLLVPLALWWQVASQVPSAAAPAALVEMPAARVDIVPVRSLPMSRVVDSPTLAEVRDLLSVGEVLAARALLAHGVAARDPDALFLLAETYDPNMLAAFGARGVGADAERARGLYTAAQSLGHEKSAGRLHGLR